MAYKFNIELTKGMKSDDVKALQERLIEIKQDTVLVDGKVKKVEADGDFGNVTAEAVESLKAKSFDFVSTEYIKEKYTYYTGKTIDPTWLEVNSTVNPLFGLFLERYEEVLAHLNVTMKTIDLTPDPELVPSHELVEEVIAFETSEIGVREKTGNNDGIRVEWYQTVGSDGEIKKGAPYCQYGQNTSLKVSAEKKKLYYKWWYNGYTPDNVNRGKKLKIVKGGNPSGGHVKKEDIKRGDWGYIYSSERRNARHVFIITGIKGNNVLTIEFNTNKQNSPEGNGVYNRIRPISQVWACVRWADLY